MPRRRGRRRAEERRDGDGDLRGVGVWWAGIDIEETLGLGWEDVERLGADDCEERSAGSGKREVGSGSTIGGAKCKVLEQRSLWGEECVVYEG
jgi:hypothetical protein